jgi:hypothetical protein
MLDGKDSTAFWSGAQYRVTNTSDNGSGPATLLTVCCDSGDKTIGGGFEGLDPSEGTISSSIPLNVVGIDGWQVRWANGATADSDVMAEVRCADFPPLRP